MKAFEARGTVKLATDRIVLRQFKPGDAERIFRNWASDPLVAEHLTWRPHTDVSVSQTVLELWISGYASHDFYQWGIELNGDLIGSIGCKEINRDLNSIDVGYALGRDYWGHGYMTEALTAVINYLFAEGYNRVWATQDIDNPASGRVLEKAGMKFEGVVRDGGIDGLGRLSDVNQWAILRRDRAVFADD